MTFPDKISNMDIKIVSLKLSDGFSGRAILCDSTGRNFTRTAWNSCLSKPQLLFEDVEKIIKTEDRNCVALRNLTIADSQLKVVIKRHRPKAGFRQFFRSFRPGKALRNFKTAVRLLSCGIDTAKPLAALHQRRALFTRQSIYITKYLENSANLTTFALEQLPKISDGCLAVKKQLSVQLAAILATLHKNGLWHRDSKASNFIVSKDNRGQYRVSLVDMDGVKRYFLQRKSHRFRSLWLLAASLMPLSAVNRTDYLRTFIIYCNLTKLEISQRRKIFRKLAERAEAKRMHKMAKNCNQ